MLENEVAGIKSTRPLVNSRFFFVMGFHMSIVYRGYPIEIPLQSNWFYLPIRSLMLGSLGVVEQVLRPWNSTVIRHADGLLGKERLVMFVPIRVHSLRPFRAYFHDGASGRPVQGFV